VSRLDEAIGGHSVVPEDWIPATGLRALMLEDPCLVWLRYHGKAHNFAEDESPYDFLDFIGQQGVDFESQWIQAMAPEAVQVMRDDRDVRMGESFVRTAALIKKGCPVITHGALWWSPEKLYGAPDVLCTTDWLFTRFPRLRPKDAEPNHYVVLDCKAMSKLDAPQKKTALHLCEVQVRLYSYMVGSITGRMPSRAFIATKDRIEGRIVDPMPVDVGMALDQPLDPELAELRDLHRHIKAHGRDYLPWRDAIVAPNFSNAGKNAPWSGAVKQIADLMPGGSIERLPGVGRQQKEALRHFGFDCLADALHPDAAGFPFWAVRGIGERKADLIEAVLEANRTGRASHIPEEVVPVCRRVEIYCDYETLSPLSGTPPPLSGSKLHEQSPDAQGGEIVFMIGCGWATTGGWQYQQFTAASHTAAAERHLFDQFLSWLEQRGVFDPGTSAALYHWSGAELIFSRRAAERLSLPRLEKLPWVDLLKAFKSVPIGVPGAFGFGLKEVGQALGKFDQRYAVEWPEGLNGLAALVAGARMYERENPLKSPEFDVLTRYLRTDVQALHSVLRFLRDYGAQDQPADNACPKLGNVATVGPASDGHDRCRAQGRGRGWYALETERGG
jgi:hypothetical protein